MEKYDITDYLKDDKELQKAVIEEFLKEIAELKTENEALIEGLGIANKYVNKYHQTLQEIKTIAEDVCKDDCPDLKWGYCIGLGECAFRARKQIIDLITKAEEE